jgi:hypothetical protein
MFFSLLHPFYWMLFFVFYIIISLTFVLFRLVERGILAESITPADAYTRSEEKWKEVDILVKACIAPGDNKTYARPPPTYFY